MTKRINIAIDGHSSTGKSSVARQLARHLGYVYVDSGAMYRAVTLYALRNGVLSKDALDKNALISCLSDVHLQFGKRKEDANVIYLNGEDVSAAIRKMDVSNWVSQVATIPEVRHKLVAIQRELGHEKGVVMDGRDIGTVVFPDAELKVFMTATAEERAHRRHRELLQRGEDVEFEEVLENVEKRDRIDSTRAQSPLVKARDAIVVDNTEMTLEEQFEVLLQLAKDRIAGNS